MSSEVTSKSDAANSSWLRSSSEATDPFPKTRWTMVRRVNSGEGSEAERALNELCSIYWYPIYAYARRTVGTPHDAEDLTQSYLARLLDRGYISRANPAKGRFRAFLLADLKLFLSNESARKRAVKRGGGSVIESFDQALAERRYGVEPLDVESPDKLFDRAWAATLLEHVREQLRRQYAAKGQEQLHEVLQPFIAWNGGEQSYAEAAATLGRTLSDIKVSVHRMRRSYRKLLEREIAETVASQADIQEEINALVALFG
jgi:DNA-directed RNA polymerase specialized sigma24 family protein